MRVALLAACAAAILFAACAPHHGRARPRPKDSGPIFRDPDYSPRSLDDRTLMVLPIAGRDPGGLADSPGLTGSEAVRPAQDDSLQDRFLLALNGLADGVFLEAERVREADTAALRRFEARLPGPDSARPVSFRFPKSLRPLGDTVKPDLGLQLADVIVHREDPKKEGIPGMPAGGFYMPQGNFGLSGDFLIWDYAESKPVAYGRFRAAVPFEAMSHAVLDAAVREAAETIVRNSPLYGPKLQEKDERRNRQRERMQVPFYHPPPDHFVPRH